MERRKKERGGENVMNETKERQIKRVCEREKGGYKDDVNERQYKQMCLQGSCCISRERKQQL